MRVLSNSRRGDTVNKLRIRKMNLASDFYREKKGLNHEAGTYQMRHGVAQGFERKARS